MPIDYAKYCEELKAAFPIGTLVEVLESDLEEYVGQYGVVVNYSCPDDEYPLAGVRFLQPVLYDFLPHSRDGFYEDELCAVEMPAVAKYLQDKVIPNIIGRKTVITPQFAEIYVFLLTTLGYNEAEDFVRTQLE